MRLYRVEKKKYADQFPPRGSLFGNGRWHRKGMWVVYTSEHISLAKLEALANSTILPKNRVISVIVLEGKAPVIHFDVNNLPENWNDIPYPLSLARFINDVITRGEYVAASVPSTQAPEEKNYLLFPEHPEFGKYVKRIELLAIEFDVRLK